MRGGARACSLRRLRAFSSQSTHASLRRCANCANCVTSACVCGAVLLFVLLLFGVAFAPRCRQATAIGHIRGAASSAHPYFSVEEPGTNTKIECASRAKRSGATPLPAPTTLPPPLLLPPLLPLPLPLLLLLLSPALEPASAASVPGPPVFARLRGLAELRGLGLTFAPVLALFGVEELADEEAEEEDEAAGLAAAAGGDGEGGGALAGLEGLDGGAVLALLIRCLHTRSCKHSQNLAGSPSKPKTQTMNRQ
jgi:hypothetical protein